MQNDLPEDIRQAAREWLTRLASDQADKADRARFDAWLQADPRHPQAYQRVQSVWADIAELHHLKDFAPLPEPDISPSPRRRGKSAGQPSVFSGLSWSWGLAAAAAILVTLFLSNPSLIPGYNSAVTYETAVAETSNIRLPDNSLVSLGAGSRIRVDFQGEQRRVTLQQGDAFFDVAHNPQRPFTVTAGGTQVQVVGTAFGIRHGVEQIRVAVQAGAVKVSAVAAAATHAEAGQLLTQGQQLVATRTGTIQSVGATNPEQVAAWRTGRLIYDNEPLAEVIADANRYYQGGVIVAASSLNRLRVTAAFRTDEIEQMLQVLSNTFGLEIQHVTPEKIYLRRAN